MVGTVSFGTFDSTTELRQSDRQSTQSRPSRESKQGRTSNSQPACPPQKLPTTLQDAQNVRDALTGQSDNLDRRIARYAAKPTHSPKDLDDLASQARCLREQLPDLQRAIGRLKEQARARSDYRSVAALQKVDNDLFQLQLKEFRRILRLDGLKEDLRQEMRCKNLPQPRTVDMAANAPVALRGDIDYLTTSIDRYLANPTREQQISVIDLLACLRNSIKDLEATLDKFDRNARAAGGTRTAARISALRSVFDGLRRDIQAQDDRIRAGPHVR
jgi:hypothetical protein